MRDDLPTGTVTFLFTDVEGSTRLLHELGADAYADALAEHRRVIREACSTHGGVEVDTQGDAFFFAFPTAPGALAAASSLTEALASPHPIRVRVGLHTGTPVSTAEGYVGDDVHRAARIAAAGHGGQVLVSSSTASLVDIDLTDLGEHRFKDLSAPERVYQLGDGPFPSLKSLYRSNLPVPVTDFLGREQELAAVADLLGREGVRLVTLTGPGGIGKTRLALHAVASMAELFADGVFWVPLARLRDAALVVPSVAEALEISEDGDRSLFETLDAELKDKRVLLLLDNAEHLMPTLATDVASLLAAVPSVTIVVTSRERLRIEGEHVYSVPTLGDDDAKNLFVSRARAVDPTFAHGKAVSELCERLDNVPLALELAAARTSLLSSGQLLERLGGRLDLLKGSRDADPRQQTLRATISWSHDLLSSEEQRTFACMSVFVGGCTLDAAEHVCESDADTLESLLDKCLVLRRDDGSGPRLWMLETIREYAAEQLTAHGIANDVARRHLDHYLALAREFYAQVRVGKYGLDEIATERDNLRVALDTALLVSPKRAVELVGCLGQYWSLGGHFSEGRLRAAAALATGTEVPASLRARALRVAASLASKQSDFDAAERLGRESLQLYRELEDGTGTGATLNVLGVVAWLRGNLSQATRLLEEALDAYDAAAADPVDLDASRVHGREITVGNLAAVAVASGDHARAIELGREIVASARGRDDFAVVIALNALGLALEATGDMTHAQESFEEGIALSRSYGFSEALAYVLASLAHLEQADRPTDALDHFRESLALMHDMGESRGIAYCLEGMSAIALSAGDGMRAATLLAAAATIREETGAALEPQELTEVNRTIAETKKALGDDTFNVSWSEGRGLPRDQAVELAQSAIPKS